MDDERRNPIDSGSKVKVNVGTLCIRPYGHNTDYTPVYVQSHSNITIRLWMILAETQLILGHGVIGQGQLCPPPCEGMPRFALSG